MMSDRQILAIVFAGGAFMLMAIASALLFYESKDRDIAVRIRSFQEPGGMPVVRSRRVGRALLDPISRLGDSLRRRVLSRRDVSDLERSLAAAGFTISKALPIFIAAKFLALIGIPLLVFVYTRMAGYPINKQFLYTGLSLPIAMMVPNWTVGFLRRPYQKALRHGVPDALDLLVVCAQAGLGLDSAIERVALEMRNSNRPVALEFGLLGHELRILPDRNTALINIGERTGQESLKRLGATLAQTLRYGTPLSQAMRVLATEMRQERLIRFEERAARLPALLVLPMICFILPCLVIILVGPAFVNLFAAFASMHP